MSSIFSKELSAIPVLDNQLGATHIVFIVEWVKNELLLKTFVVKGTFSRCILVDPIIEKIADCPKFSRTQIKEFEMGKSIILKKAALVAELLDTKIDRHAMEKSIRQVREGQKGDLPMF